MLVAPAHDSVLRTPTGRIGLSADATDDLGLVSAAFEYIVSSGEGETFKFASGTIGAVKPSGRHATIASSISIDSLALKPGDIVHLRAVARDANDVTGPGIGVSETRSIRIARKDEYDSVAVDAAGPADEEKSVISQRMLIILAEALQKRRPSLRRDTRGRRITTDRGRPKEDCVARSATSCSRDWAAIRAAKSIATRSLRIERRRWRRCWPAPILRRIEPMTR